MTAPADRKFSSLRLEGVTRRFGGQDALVNLNLTVQQGEFVALLGPSGCGKSTALNCLAGLLPLTSGSIWRDSTRLDTVPPERRGFGMVFQNYALFPHLTIFENVAFGLRRRGIADKEVKSRVSEMLELVELPGFERRKPTQISGGQAQRVALARALINRPAVLLLDEPLGALDLKLRKQMQVELKRIQQEVGITFIYVTHDQEEAMTMSDRLAVMRLGKIEQLGDPEAIYEMPATPFVARFIGIANLLPAVVEQPGERVTIRLACDTALDVSHSGIAIEAGARMLCMIRPERVNLFPQGLPAGVIGLPVTIADLVFQGAVLRYGLRDASGGEIIAHVESEDRDPSIRVGDRVWAGWDPGAARLLPPEA